MITEKLFSDAVGGDSDHVADHMPSTSIISPHVQSVAEKRLLSMMPPFEIKIWAWSSLRASYPIYQVFEESMVDDGGMTIPCQHLLTP